MDFTNDQIRLLLDACHQQVSHNIGKDRHVLRELVDCRDAHEPDVAQVSGSLT